MLFVPLTRNVFFHIPSPIVFILTHGNRYLNKSQFPILKLYQIRKTILEANSCSSPLHLQTEGPLALKYK